MSKNSTIMLLHWLTFCNTLVSKLTSITKHNCNVFLSQLLCNWIITPVYLCIYSWCKVLTYKALELAWLFSILWNPILNPLAFSSLSPIFTPTNTTTSENLLFKIYSIDWEFRSEHLGLLFPICKRHQYHFQKYFMESTVTHISIGE